MTPDRSFLRFRVIRSFLRFTSFLCFLTIAFLRLAAQEAVKEHGVDASGQAVATEEEAAAEMRARAEAKRDRIQKRLDQNRKERVQQNNQRSGANR